MKLRKDKNGTLSGLCLSPDIYNLHNTEGNPLSESWSLPGGLSPVFSNCLCTDRQSRTLLAHPYKFWDWRTAPRTYCCRFTHCAGIDVNWTTYKWRLKEEVSDPASFRHRSCCITFSLSWEPVLHLYAVLHCWNIFYHCGNCLAVLSQLCCHILPRSS